MRHSCPAVGSKGNLSRLPGLSSHNAPVSLQVPASHDVAGEPRPATASSSNQARTKERVTHGTIPLALADRRTDTDPRADLDFRRLALIALRVVAEGLRQQ